MRIFSPLYRRAMIWSRHRHAPWYLGGMSFAESSFFPIPPDVMLAPMCLAEPRHAWRFALVTTLASVVGRGARFFLVTGLMKRMHMEAALHRYVNRLSRATVAMVAPPLRLLQSLTTFRRGDDPAARNPRKTT